MLFYSLWRLHSVNGDGSVGVHALYFIPVNGFSPFQIFVTQDVYCCLTERGTSLQLYCKKSLMLSCLNVMCNHFPITKFNSFCNFQTHTNCLCASMNVFPLQSSPTLIHSLQMRRFHLAAISSGFGNQG